MTVIFGFFLCVLATVNAAAIDETMALYPEAAAIIAPTELFSKSWEFHDKFADLQKDIDLQLTAIRTSVSTVLKSSSNATLSQIESNAGVILAQDEPARNAIFAIRPSTVCVNNLKTLINGITEFTGFGSSNCVAVYDKSVQGALNTAYALLQKYEGSFGDVQQVVVRSFIGKNALTSGDDIIERFEQQFAKRSADWAAIRPDVENFVLTLDSNIAVFNTVLGSCFKKIQDDVAPAYGLLQAEISTCAAFDSTPDPFAIFRA